MAFLIEDEKIKGQGQATEGQGAADPLANQNSSGMAPVIGGGSAVVGNAGASTAGVGSGGTGGWTNIQSYINANKDVDTGAAGMINQKVGSAFDSERSKLSSAADDAKKQGQAQAQGISEAAKNANQWLDQASKAYSWDGKHGDDYNTYSGKIKDSINAQYTGPSSFSYALGADASRYADTLRNDDAFNQFLGDQFQEKAGRLSSGGRALQKQLDVNNVALNNARENLLKKYSELGSFRDQTISETDQALGSAAEEFRNNQMALRDNLFNTSSSLDSEIAKQEAAARLGYDTALQGKSGRSNVGYQRIMDLISGAEGATNSLTGRQLRDRKMARDAFGENLSYRQLENERDAYGAKLPQTKYASQYAQNLAALENFYKNMEAQYGNTADAEERKFNLIQDILGSDTERKKQGFNARVK